MAEPPPPRPPRPPELRTDRAVDTRYIKDNSSKSAYAKAPWEHCVDPLASYLSLRFAEKDKFLVQLHKVSPSKLIRVEREIVRIISDRQKFLGSTKKHALTTELKQSLADWRETVFDLSELEDIEQTRHEKHTRGGKELRDWDSAHLKQLKNIAAESNPTTKSSRRGRRSLSMSSLRRSTSQPRVAKQPLQPDQESRTENRPGDPYHGFKAGVMYFEKQVDGTLRGINSEYEGYQDTKFPNQKISLEDILDNSDDNPLREKPSRHIVRYFHFPSNNMEWIEKAIKQYYADNDFPSKDRTRLLSREYWTGQMHGGEPVDKAFWDTSNGTRRIAPVHWGHMRSKCLLVPREARPTIQTRQSTDEIDDMKSLKGVQSTRDPLAEKNVAIFLPYLHWETSSRRALMAKVINEATGTSKTRRTQSVLTQTVDEAVRKKLKSEGNDKHKLPGMKRRQYLARYLFAVARVAREMHCMADENMLREKFENNSPLQPRCTLDQYYFSTLDKTSDRDQDQVVYRGTRAITLTPKVIMVDQLWMWILDDNTIITAFSNRWGRNRPDPSGVYKSLRIRLGQRTEVIKSTYHLAIMIMDQCSRVFFDRTQPPDQRPEVMDLFAAAIGSVNERTKLAYNYFWRAIAIDPNYSPTIVINPEGSLLKEAQDIVEELMIMKRIYTEQIIVAKELVRHLSHPHGGHVAVSENALLISKLIYELKRTTSHNTERDEDDLPEFSDLDRLIDEESVHEAQGLVELLQSRLDELLNLEEAGMRACAQLEGVLALKSQQAAIVDARAALVTAKESYKQGRTIQAFTIVTIVFLPLGFIAAFFGMNNMDINEAPWMSLQEQINWMFGGTAIVIFISISLAFGNWFHDLLMWIRTILRFAFDVLWAVCFQWTENTGLYYWWRTSFFNSKNLDRKRESILADIARKKMEIFERRGSRKSESRVRPSMLSSLLSPSAGDDGLETRPSVDTGNPNTGYKGLQQQLVRQYQAKRANQQVADV